MVLLVCFFVCFFEFGDFCVVRAEPKKVGDKREKKNSSLLSPAERARRKGMMAKQVKKLGKKGIEVLSKKKFMFFLCFCAVFGLFVCFFFSGADARRS